MLFDGSGRTLFSPDVAGESITDAAVSFQQSLRVTIADVLPQTLDLLGDRGVGHDLAGPGRSDEVIFTEDFARSTQEGEKKVVKLCREGAFLAASLDGLSICQEPAVVKSIGDNLRVGCLNPAS
jgi:hypothetical protein